MLFKLHYIQVHSLLNHQKDLNLVSIHLMLWSSGKDKNKTCNSFETYDYLNIMKYK